MSSTSPQIETSSSEFVLIIDALLETQTILERQTRNSIIQQLPKKIIENLKESNTPRVAIISIVEACFRYKDGFETLIRKINASEGSSRAMGKVYTTLNELGFDLLVKSLEKEPLKDAATYNKQASLNRLNSENSNIVLNTNDEFIESLVVDLTEILKGDLNRLLESTIRQCLLILDSSLEKRLDDEKYSLASIVVEFFNSDEDSSLINKINDFLIQFSENLKTILKSKDLKNTYEVDKHLKKFIYLLLKLLVFDLDNRLNTNQLNKVQDLNVETAIGVEIIASRLFNRSIMLPDNDSLNKRLNYSEVSGKYAFDLNGNDIRRPDISPKFELFLLAFYRFVSEVTGNLREARLDDKLNAKEISVLNKHIQYFLKSSNGKKRYYLISDFIQSNGMGQVIQENAENELIDEFSKFSKDLFIFKYGENILEHEENVIEKEWDMIQILGANINEIREIFYGEVM